MARRDDKLGHGWSVLVKKSSLLRFLFLLYSSLINRSLHSNVYLSLPRIRERKRTATSRSPGRCLVPWLPGVACIGELRRGRTARHVVVRGAAVYLYSVRVAGRSARCTYSGPARRRAPRDVCRAHGGSAWLTSSEIGVRCERWAQPVKLLSEWRSDMACVACRHPEMARACASVELLPGCSACGKTG